MEDLHIEQQPITIGGSKIAVRGSSPPTAAPEYDPFEEVVVAHDQSYAGMASRKEQLVIQERKPGDQEWFRVHPDRSMHQRVNIFVDKVTNEKGATLSGKTYLVTHMPRDGVRLPDPTWPDLTGKELLRKAFSERVISDLDHPLIQALFGYR